MGFAYSAGTYTRQGLNDAAGVADYLPAMWRGVSNTVGNGAVAVGGALADFARGTVGAQPAQPIPGSPVAKAIQATAPPAPAKSQPLKLPDGSTVQGPTAAFLASHPASPWVGYASYDKDGKPVGPPIAASDIRMQPNFVPAGQGGAASSGPATGYDAFHQMLTNNGGATPAQAAVMREIAGLVPQKGMNPLDAQKLNILQTTSAAGDAIFQQRMAQAQASGDLQAIKQAQDDYLAFKGRFVSPPNVVADVNNAVPH